MVGDKVVSERRGGGGGGQGGGGGIQNQKQEPHTKMWGMLERGVSQALRTPGFPPAFCANLAITIRNL